MVRLLTLALVFVAFATQDRENLESNSPHGREVSPLPARCPHKLELATAPILDQHLELFKGHVDALVFQLADLTFIDAFGLRGLLAYEKNPGQGVSIRTPSRRVRRLLEIVDFESIIDDSPTTLYA